jgi:hypothetical protein
LRPKTPTPTTATEIGFLDGRRSPLAGRLPETEIVNANEAEGL